MTAGWPTRRNALHVPHAVQREAVHRRCGTPVSCCCEEPGSRVCSAGLRPALHPGHASSASESIETDRCPTPAITSGEFGSRAIRPGDCDVRLSLDCALPARGRRCSCGDRCQRRRRGADRGGEEGAAGRLVHHADRQSGDPAAEGGVREEISGHGPAICPRRRKPDRGEAARRGQCRTRAGRRVRRHLQHDPAQARRHRRALCAAVGGALSGRDEGQGRLLVRDPALRVVARHQHRPGAEGDRAEDLSGPARSRAGRARWRGIRPRSPARRVSSATSS